MSFSWSKFVELMVVGNSAETLCGVMYIEISRCHRWNISMAFFVCLVE